MGHLKSAQIFLSVLVCAGIVWAGGSNSAQKLPVWVVEVSYHHPGSDSESEVTARWRYEVVEEVTRPDGSWWRVSVRDADGRTPLEADFLLDPQGGRIAGIHVRKFFQGAWHAYPCRQADPTPMYLQSFGALPLDYCNPRSIGADRVLHFRRTERQPVDEQMVFQRKYDIRLDPEVAPAQAAGKVSGLADSTESLIRLEIEDSFQPGSRRTMTWDRRLPWWREYATPAYTARLVEWEGGWHDAR